MLSQIKALDQQEYDLIFLDLVMPDMDGSEVIKHIKEKDEQAKVVIITGYPDGELMMRAMEYGPLLVLKKPFTADDILEAVSSFAKSTHP